MFFFVVSQFFLRGGLLITWTWVSDSPQKAKLLYCKHPNNSTKLPCPYCKAEQDERLSTCGDLGNARYDVDANRQTMGGSPRWLARVAGIGVGPERANEALGGTRNSGAYGG
ncbi:unnamed protein product [Ectocarpus sp. CCAP 1310/34]|nr:unnamed protein product [Ectocarpus sp. CCAP 1310/34]